MVANHAALTGDLPSDGIFGTVASAAALVEEMEEEAAADFVREVVGRLFRRTGRSVSEGILHEMGSAAAATYLLQRFRYARARKAELMNIDTQRERHTPAA